MSDISMDKSAKRRFSVTLTRIYIDALNQLVEEGIYLEPQVAIRDAMRRLFRYHRIEPFYSEFVEEVENVQK